MASGMAPILQKLFFSHPEGFVNTFRLTSPKVHNTDYCVVSFFGTYTSCLQISCCYMNAYVFVVLVFYIVVASVIFVAIIKAKSNSGSVVSNVTRL